jgi:hypothetical protein
VRSKQGGLTDESNLWVGHFLACKTRQSTETTVNRRSTGRGVACLFRMRGYALVWLLDGAQLKSHTIRSHTIRSHTIRSHNIRCHTVRAVSACGYNQRPTLNNSLCWLRLCLPPLQERNERTTPTRARCPAQATLVARIPKDICSCRVQTSGCRVQTSG